MKTQEIVDVWVGESTQLDYGYELSDRCIIMGHRTKRFFQWSGKMGERL